MARAGRGDLTPRPTLSHTRPHTRPPLQVTAKKERTSKLSPWLVGFLIFVVVGGPLFQLLSSVLAAGNKAAGGGGA